MFKIDALLIDQPIVLFSKNSYGNARRCQAFRCSLSRQKEGIDNISVLLDITIYVLEEKIRKLARWHIFCDISCLFLTVKAFCACYLYLYQYTIWYVPGSG